jgi:glycosyltransferase involved in cell wall biosynthesis
LAAALMQLKGDAAQRERMGQAGRRQVEEHYTWQQVARRLHGIYGQVLSDGN